MKRIVTLLLLLSGVACSQEYIIATRPYLFPYSEQRVTNSDTNVVIVSGAGTPSSDGVYVWEGGNFSDGAGNYIEPGWFLYDEDLGDYTYTSTNNPASFWDSTGWHPIDGGALPVPTFTKGLATNTVNGSQGWQLNDVSMPLGLWTNCVLAIHAKMPFVGTNTTAFKVLGWSSNKLDLAQSVSGNQPNRVLSNGVYGIRFDGIDDRIVIPDSSNRLNFGSADFSIRGEVSYSAAADVTVISKWDFSANKRQWRLRFLAGQLSFATSSDGITQSSSLITPPAGFFKFSLEKTGTNVIWKINGTNVVPSGSVIADIGTTQGSQVTIGAVGDTSVAGFYDGVIRSLEVFNGRLP